MQCVQGSTFTRFELDLAPGVKVSKITALSKDLARALSAVSVRVVEVIPGKSVIGLELPNTQRDIVTLSQVLDSKAFNEHSSHLAMVLGGDIAGQPVVADGQNAAFVGGRHDRIGQVGWCQCHDFKLAL